MSKVYEDLAAFEGAGRALRPGGFDLADRALDIFRSNPEALLLDIGCGSGATLGYLKQCGGIRSYGIDPSPVLLNRARGETDYLSLVRGRGECLPFASAIFDGVIAECVLSITGYDVVTSECLRVLKNKGYLFLSDIYLRDSAAMPGAGAREQCDGAAKILSRLELCKIIEEHGFVLHSWEDRSPALREFAARVILAGSSLEALWNSLCGGAPPGGASATISGKPCWSSLGYFSLLARKQD